MRIAYLHGYGLNGSGSAIYATELSASLAGQGHDVRVICHESRQDVLTSMGPVVQTAWGMRCFGSGVSMDAITDVAVPVAYSRPELTHQTTCVLNLDRAGREAYIERMVQHVRELHASDPFDLLVVNHLALLSVVASRVQRELGVAFIVVVHGTGLHYVLRRSPDIRQEVRACIHRASRVIALNPSVYDRVRDAIPDFDPDKIEMVGPGVDIGTFQTGALTRPQDLAFVGRMTLDKGVHCLLAAFCDVRKRVPDARLHLVGDGPDRELLMAAANALDRGDVATFKSLCRRAASGREVGAHELVDPIERWQPMGCTKGISQSIVWHGYLGRQETAHIVGNCKVSVLPSIVPEAFPLVILEAMACGTRPVSSDAAGQRWILSRVEQQLTRLAGILRVPMDAGTYVRGLAERTVTGLVERPSTEAARLRDYVIERHRWGSVSDSVLAVPRAAVVLEASA